ncbi:MAG: MFS transporter, partial [Actinobacteria bacterium]|nr:MFS transporter [Actinomycetota bacterium]
MPELALPDAAHLRGVRRRTIRVLSLGQVLGGVAFGATISLGAVLSSDISGDEAFAGLATAFVTLGAAAVAVPLAALARRRGRRIALGSGMLLALGGVVVVVAAASVRVFPLLLLG